MSHELIILLTLLTAGAGSLAWILSRFKLSPILGYLALGVLSGPFRERLGLPERIVDQIAEVGLILLLFFLGIEFHLSDARKALKAGIVGGGGQMALCFGAAAFAAWCLGHPVLTGVAFGLIVIYSSTALVMKAFTDRQETDAPHAKAALAVLLAQDLVAILVVVLLPVMAMRGQADSAESMSWMPLLKKISILFIAVPVLFITARRMLPWLFTKLAARQNPEVFALFCMAACFSVAMAAEAAGASLALGAFLGGLVLCDTIFANQIRADLSMIRNLSLALFFISVGMMLDVGYAVAHAPYLALALAATVLVKTVLTAGALKLSGVSLPVACAAGLALAQVGEFAFVVARVARRENLLAQGDFTFLLALTALSMALTSFLVAWSARLVRVLKRTRLPSKKTAPGTPAEKISALPPTSSSIVVGYGPVGQTTLRILEDFNARPTIIDLNYQTVQALNRAGKTALYGDACRREILEAAGIQTAKYILVTLPDIPGRLAVVAQARLLNPEVEIYVRARFLRERLFLQEAGATHISFEEGEVAVHLAELLLERLGADEKALRAEGKRIRAGFEGLDGSMMKTKED